MVYKTTPSKKKPIALVFVLLAVSCAPTEKVSRGMYDGLQKREQMVNTRDEPVLKENASYDAYKREREEILTKEMP